MNKLFIIGNGFDLAHGLKTSYQDFILWYFNQAISEFRKNGSYSDKYFINKIRTIPTDLDKVVSVEEIVMLTNTGKDGNFIFLNFPFATDLIKELHSYNWVDIEIKYYDILKEIVNGKVKKQPEIIDSAKFLNDTLSFLKDKLIEYLLSLKIEKTNFLPNVDLKIKNVLNQTRLLNERNHRTKSIGLRNENQFRIALVNFNYTDIITNYLIEAHLFNLQIDSINIHGNLIDEKNKIIFGYGDEMDNHYKIIENYNENEFLKNMKSFGYYLSKNYQRLLEFIETGAYEVHIMGHSCGLSDRVLLNTLFENDNCQQIHIYYHDKGKGQNNFTDLTMNISRNFNDKAKMRKRVLPITECVPLV